MLSFAQQKASSRTLDPHGSSQHTPQQTSSAGQVLYEYPVWVCTYYCIMISWGTHYCYNMISSGTYVCTKILFYVHMPAIADVLVTRLQYLQISVWKGLALYCLHAVAAPKVFSPKNVTGCTPTKVWCFSSLLLAPSQDTEEAHKAFSTEKLVLTNETLNRWKIPWPTSWLILLEAQLVPFWGEITFDSNKIIIPKRECGSQRVRLKFCQPGISAWNIYLNITFWYHTDRHEERKDLVLAVGLMSNIFM